MVGLDLCPFARAPLEAGALRVAVTEAESFDDCVRSALGELDRLHEDPSIETTLVVFARGLATLEDLLDAAAALEHLVQEAGLEGVVQVVSFHPDYAFEGASPDDHAAYTHRSPYPMLHLLREASVTAAVDRHPDARAIPDQNARRLRAMSLAELARLAARARERG